MASLINSLRSIASDPWWVVKISFFACILFFVMDNDLNYPNGNPALTPVYMVIFVAMLGCASIAMHRNINNKTPLFPSVFNIFEIISKSVCATIAILPGILIYSVVISFIQNKIVLEPFVMAVIYICVTLFFVPFIFIPVVLYSVNANLFDSFNFKNIYEGSGNFTVQFLSYLLQFAFFICLGTYCIYIFLLQMLGDHVSLLILKCVVIVVSFFSVFIFCSDLYEDVIPELKKKEKKKLKRKIP